MDSSIKDIADKFLREEKMPTTNALSFAGLGLTKSVGDVAEIAYGVGFSGHPYSDERKSEMAEVLGDILFYWHILAITSGIPWQDIMQRWISEWLVKQKVHIADDDTQRVSIKDLLKHMKRKDKISDEILRETERLRQQIALTNLQKAEKQDYSQSKQI
jgi:NTP pyrophosphatase (non-canonical NTP hydrolase)